jgi:hypothetical protein
MRVESGQARHPGGTGLDSQAKREDDQAGHTKQVGVDSMVKTETKNKEQRESRQVMSSEVMRLWQNLGAVMAGAEVVEGPVQQPGGPSGSFNRAVRAWEALPGVDPRVLKWLREGVDQRPGPECVPMPWNMWGGSEWNATKNEEEEKWLRDEHERWLATGISEPVDDDDREGFWHPLKVARFLRRCSG